MYKIFFFICVCISLFRVEANTVSSKLYINSGNFLTVKGTTFPYVAFSSTFVFNQTNSCIYLKTGDTLVLCIKNNDTIQHGFKVKSIAASFLISPTDSIFDTLVFSQRSIHVFYDQLNFPDNKNLGLAGFIAVYENSTANSYLWNIKDHQSNYNQTLSTGATVDWTLYLPNYFTVNEKSYSDIQLDANAKITATVGDTIYIYIANTGQSMHSLHFHGFHSETLFSNSKIIPAGWIKDTWGLFSMDAIVLQMIPDKAGRYSVHDHNLVAVTGGSTHPNGMFTIMDINP